MRSTVALLALLALAGCLGAAPAPDPAPGVGPAPLALSEPVRALGRLTREPAIAELPGALFVAGYSYGDVAALGPTFLLRPDFVSPPVLWRSADGGASWAMVDMGALPDGALGNSDIDLATGPDGTLYVAAMSFSYVGHSIVAGASEDAGATWRWRPLSAQPLVDRPWVETAPDGAAHVVWNDGKAVHHAASRDRGVTWQEGPVVADDAGDGGLAVGPQGELAVRVIPASGSGYTYYEGRDGVAVSTDRGATWSFRPVPGQREYGGGLHESRDPLPRWADPVAFDTAGTLYTAWGENATLFLARSRDLGSTWDLAEVARGEGGAAYPHLRGGPSPGVLAVSWFELFSDHLVAHVALVKGADTAAPRVRAGGFVPDTQGDTGGEYFQVAFLADGRLGFATPVQPGPSEGPAGFEFRSAR